MLRHSTAQMVLRFGVLDAVDADVVGSDSVLGLDAINDRGGALVITLEWDTDETDLDLYVIEPSGKNARNDIIGVGTFFTYCIFAVRRCSILETATLFCRGELEYCCEQTAHKNSWVTGWNG